GGQARRQRPHASHARCRETTQRRSRHCAGLCSGRPHLEVFRTVRWCLCVESLGVTGWAAAALRAALKCLKRIGAEPESAPPSLVATLALVPPVAAGAILFRLVALEVVGIAVAAGLLAHLAAR